MQTVIVVPCWDLDENQGFFTNKYVTDCLKSDIGDSCLVVVDNGSEYKPTRVFLDSVKDSRYKLIRNKKNLGYAKACNQGVKWGLASGADYFVLSNNDILLGSEDWLNEFLAPLRENHKILLGARVIVDNGMTDIDGNGCIPYAEGWMVGFHRSLTDQIGLPFDPMFASYFEDVDLGVRAALAGFPIVQSPAFRWRSNGHISVAIFEDGIARHISGSTGYVRPDFNWSKVTNESRDYFTKKWGLEPKTNT